MLKKICLLSLLLFQIACSTIPEKTNPSITETPVAATKVLAGIKSATATVVQPTQTPTLLPTATSTPTNLPVPPLRVQCINLLPTMPAGVRAGGLVILSNTGQFEPETSYLLDMASLERIELPVRAEGAIYTSFEVSPNRQLLAYWVGFRDSPQPSRLVITSVDGQWKQEYPWNEDWWGYLWQNNEQLLFSTKEDFTLSLLNVFTSEQMKLNVKDYPSMKDLWGEVWVQAWDVYFNASMDRAVYIGGKPSLGFGLVLTDIPAQKELGIYPKGGTTYNPPDWSDDGHKLAAGFNHKLDETHLADEIYEIDRDGKATRLTYFTESYTNVGLGNFSWSPDGRYIAFEVNLRPISYPDYELPDQSGRRLAVLDIQTRQVTNYCIPTGPYYSTLTWSPDSRQILIENNGTSDNGFTNIVILVDIGADFAVKVAEDINVFGWLVSP